MPSHTATANQAIEQSEYLREILSPGDTVYVTTVHVARSGMSRRVKVFVVRPAEPAVLDTSEPLGDRITYPVKYPAQRAKIRNITWMVGRALQWRLYDDGEWSIRIDGAGMDMHFHLVYSLSRVLFDTEDAKRHPGHGNGTDPGYLLTKVTL